MQPGRHPYMKDSRHTGVQPLRLQRRRLSASPGEGDQRRCPHRCLRLKGHPFCASLSPLGWRQLTAVAPPNFALQSAFALTVPTAGLWLWQVPEGREPMSRAVNRGRYQHPWLATRSPVSRSPWPQPSLCSK